MLDNVLNVLSIIGIILFVLLCMVILLLILVLFFPISYRLTGSKSVDMVKAKIRAFWLFGILRVNFIYPEPGKVIVKFLCFTVYDSTKKKEDNDSERDSGEATDQKKAGASQNATEEKKTKVNADETNMQKANKEASNVINADTEKSNADTQSDTARPDNSQESNGPEQTEPQNLKDNILSKYRKIKYTILKIYDKIKHIWDNITFYKNLLQEERTKELFRHLGMRLQKIWKNIHPRKLKADIYFGADSPDITGYVFGVYSMISPQLGKHVNVTPDFTQAVFEGNVYIAGHITVFQVLFHSLMFALDKRLKNLIAQVKERQGK